jgi:hypothetical protein
LGTYATLYNVLASTAAPADRPHLLDRLKALVSYKMVTVDAVDKDTGKVSCGAMLNFSGSPEGVKAISGLYALRALAQASGDAVPEIPIGINDQDANHVSFQIHYTVQKAQDSGGIVVLLDQARFLAQVLGEGISAADKASQQSSSSASPVEAANNAASPVGDNQSAATTNDDASSVPPEAIGGAAIGMKISDFRQRVQAAGYTGSPDPGRDCANDVDCQDANDPALQSCAADQPLCEYVFAKDGKYLRVVTRGENDDPVVTVAEISAQRPD